MRLEGLQLLTHARLLDVMKITICTLTRLDQIYNDFKWSGVKLYAI
jgi:hypothetical protein